MAILMKQSCETCGQTRDLPMALASRTLPSPDRGGWRQLSSGAREVTLCNSCIALIVLHAEERAAARKDGHAGTRNENPLVLYFAEWKA